MPGLGDGVLGDGVLGEAGGDVSVSGGTPSALVLTVQAATIAINQSISFGAGTSELNLTANTATVDISGNITVTPDVLDALTLTVNSATVEIAGVVNIAYTPNAIELSLSAQTPAYVGELVVVGLMSGSFSVAKPEMAFTVSKPEMAFTVH